MVDFESFLPNWKLKPIIENFLNEDIPFWDISSISVPKRSIKADVILKEKAIIAGLPIAKFIFNLLDCEISTNFSDGINIESTPLVILTVEGLNTNILSAERLVLNLLGRLSSIASSTSKANSIVKKSISANNANIPIISATRKTTPGLRLFEKYAVLVGGGNTHRLSLSDEVMLKNNHLKFFESITDAIKRTKKYSSFTHKIEVETETKIQAIEAAKAGADIIMLDNFSADKIGEIVKKIKTVDNSILVEASGGINLSNLEEYSKTGVDIISLGSITHSIKNIDFSLEILD
ncbi:MAG: putative nicotinate-nucleotide pyrophosphorylase [carboxylating] [Candidatus Heimdallarchaeota archaeon LC_3]|nr:MAG: putative nicotinate-nucleotide pyrophosphorylase [carboxylating] [Candidatus Heimdallarchaeota archaeon LC_3]